MLLNPNWRRLGDLAAGTIVVKTARTPLKPIQPTTRAVTPSDYPPPKTFDYAEWIQTTLVTETEIAVIGEYIARRSALSLLRRMELARTIANPIIEKMAPEKMKGNSVNVDKFLKEVYALKISQAD